MTTLRDAGEDFPIRQAWRDVRDVAKAKAWHWPAFETINRSWKALPDAQRLAARMGRDATLKALAQPAHRDKTQSMRWIGYHWMCEHKTFGPIWVTENPFGSQ